MKHFFKFSSRLKKNSRGQGIIELALIFPFLFIFFYAISEYSTLFVHDQRVTALSREAAGAAFRECGGLEDSKLTTCLQGIASEVFNRGDSILKDFSSRGHVIVSVYEADESSGVVDQLDLQESGNGGIGTQFSAGDFDAGFMEENGLVVVGEAYYENEVLTPIQRLLTLLQLPTSLYEATLF